MSKYKTILKEEPKIYNQTNLKSIKILTLCRSMDFSLKSDTFKSGWSIVYIEWSQIMISEKIVFFSLKVDFV